MEQVAVDIDKFKALPTEIQSEIAKNITDADDVVQLSKKTDIFDSVSKYIVSLNSDAESENIPFDVVSKLVNLKNISDNISVDINVESLKLQIPHNLTRCNFVYRQSINMKDVYMLTKKLITWIYLANKIQTESIIRLIFTDVQNGISNRCVFIIDNNVLLPIMFGIDAGELYGIVNTLTDLKLLSLSPKFYESLTANTQYELSVWEDIGKIIGINDELIDNITNDSACILLKPIIKFVNESDFGPYDPIDSDKTQSTSKIESNELKKKLDYTLSGYVTKKMLPKLILLHAIHNGKYSDQVMDLSDLEKYFGKYVQQYNEDDDGAEPLNLHLMSIQNVINLSDYMCLTHTEIGSNIIPDPSDVSNLEVPGIDFDFEAMRSEEQIVGDVLTIYSEYYGIDVPGF